MRRSVLLFPVMALAFLASVVTLLSLATGHAQGEVIVPPGNVPEGYTHSLVASDLTNPMDMAFAPNGRLFVAEQSGVVRVVRADGSLATFTDISDRVDSVTGERGLLGIAFDPNFSNNHFVYLYFTKKASATTPAHNRVIRITSDRNRAVVGSDKLIFRLNNQTRARHLGGAIDFGNDGKLYVSTGDNKISKNAQKRSNLFGKMLRINKDGTIPSDNPFYATASGKNRAIWALGLRNPFKIAVKPGALFVNDVGEQSWEEINRGASGANYGWPVCEGDNFFADPDNNCPDKYRSPIHAYPHSSTNPDEATGCAITGGAFYNPATVQFPDYHVGDYFFADLCSGWIRRYDVASDKSHNFATGLTSIVDLEVSEDGELYYLSRSDPGFVGKIGRPSP